MLTLLMRFVSLKQIHKITREIEQDTNYRKQVEMGAPEPENLLSRHTKQTLNIRDKRVSNIKYNHKFVRIFRKVLQFQVVLL